MNAYRAEFGSVVSPIMTMSYFALIPSRVSGRGYKIVLCTDQKFRRRVDLDIILNEFEGQGHRSKVKVARMKNVIFGFSDGLACADSLCHVI